MSNAEYMRQRYHARREDAIARLGGKCVICGSTENLQLDHIYREEKSFQISQMWSISKEKWEQELAKCQLLCPDCHKAKNTWEVGAKAAIRTHGTLSSYRYCKCPLCRKAYSDYWKTYKAKKTRRKAEPPAKAPGLKRL